MKTFVEHLSSYAEYHRDSRNIMTHLVGVPIIVFSVILLLSRPALEIAGFSFSPAMVMYFLTIAFYLSLNIAFGIIMAILMGAGIYAAASIAQMSTLVWLGSGIGLFGIGWFIQFVGHYYEGRKPAFVDDIMGLMIGPLFVLAEILFVIGLFKNLQADIESRAGKVVNRSKNITSS